MKNYSFYDQDTGLFNPLQFATTDDSTVSLNTPSNCVAIEGAYDYTNQMFDIATGQVVPYVPPAPSDMHVWHEQLRTYQLKPDVVAARAKDSNARRKIQALEAKQPRIMREILVSDSPEKAMKMLHDIEDEIITLRKDLLT